MPGPYGITANGFVAKPLADIKTDLEASFRTIFGNSIDLSPDSAMSEIIGTFAERLADAWQLGQGIYTQAFPDGSQGVGLDQIAALTGTARKPATFSKVDCVCSGTPGTVISANRTISVLGTGAKFKNPSPGTIGGGGTITIEFQAVESGPVTAPAGTLTVIETPVAGWSSVTNPLDQKLLGTEIESDSALRLRRELSLRALGGASLDAIRAGLLEVANVTSAQVFENPTDATDMNGLPPHAIECVVAGGANSEVAAKIFERKPGGIPTYGTSSESVVDLSFATHTVNFSRPTTLNVYVTINVTAKAALAPTTLANDLKAAIVAYGDQLYTVGSTVYAVPLTQPVFDASESVIDVTGLFIGTSPSPGSAAPIVATNRQIPDLDTSRVVVNLTLV